MTTESIGSVHMLKNRAIVVTLRAVAGGILGDAVFTIEPYETTWHEVLKHVGGLEPGDDKPLPPWR